MPKYRKTDWEALKAFPNFFLDLPVMEGVRELWDMVPEERRRILTAVPVSVNSCDNHKRDSVKRHFGIEGDAVICVHGRKLKCRYAEHGDILIDDRSDNIEEWVNAGGTGILFQSVPQAIEEFRQHWPIGPDKAIRELSWSDLPYVYFDLDGVLLDFDRLYIELLGDWRKDKND